MNSADVAGGAIVGFALATTAMLVLWAMFGVEPTGDGVVLSGASCVVGSIIMSAAAKKKR